MSYVHPFLDHLGPAPPPLDAAELQVQLYRPGKGNRHALQCPLIHREGVLNRTVSSRPEIAPCYGAPPDGHATRRASCHPPHSQVSQVSTGTADGADPWYCGMLGYKRHRRGSIFRRRYSLPTHDQRTCRETTEGSPSRCCKLHKLTESGGRARSQITIISMSVARLRERCADCKPLWCNAASGT